MEAKETKYKVVTFPKLWLKDRIKEIGTSNIELAEAMGLGAPNRVTEIIVGARNVSAAEVLSMAGHLKLNLESLLMALEKEGFKPVPDSENIDDVDSLAMILDRLDWNDRKRGKKMKNGIKANIIRLTLEEIQDIHDAKEKSAKIYHITDLMAKFCEDKANEPERTD